MKKTLIMLSALAVGLGSMAATGAEKTEIRVGGASFDNCVRYQKPAEPRQAQTRADEEMSYVFTYAQDIYSAATVANEAGTAAIKKVAGSVCFELREETIKELAGNKITDIIFYSPTTQSQTNPITNGIVWISTDLSQTPTVRKGSKISSTGFGLNTITLDEPYELTEGSGPLYIGFTVMLPSTVVYFIPIDGVATDENNCIVGYANSVLEQPTNWQNLAPDYGSACISIKVVGDNLPTNKVQVVSSSIPDHANTDEAFTYQLTIRNKGANEISKVTVATTVGDRTDSSEIELSKAIASSESTTIDVDVPGIVTPGLYLVESCVTKLNDGVDNGNADSKVRGSLSVYGAGEGYDQMVVLEDATGTWCGWCPAGIEMLKVAREKYADKIIPIGVHYGDDMAINSYAGFLSAYVSGYPTVVVNRSFTVGPTSYSSTQMNSVLKSIINKATAVKSYADLDLYVKSSEDQTQAEVVVSSEFIFDTQVPHYYSFVIIEDGVGPYDQTNYYAGGSNGTMGDWSKSSESSISTIYDDVAVYYDRYPGIEGSIPSNLKKETKYWYDTKLPLSAVTGENYRVVALLTNAMNGVIVNAAIADCNKSNSAVKDITDTNAQISVKGGKGEIIVSGAQKVNVYTLDGRKASTTGLTPGLYIVKADGKSAKVMVK